jgi:hypothetical protein
MSAHLIKWRKEYHEDIGEEDENGFFDYVYRYFIYHFYLPDKTLITVRQYTDTIDECAFYFTGADEQLIKQIKEELLRYLPCVVDFMISSQGVKKLLYFDGRYLPLVLKEEKCSGEVSLVEIAAAP